MAPGTKALAQENGPTARPVEPGRISNLSGKVAVITGAARGIGGADDEITGGDSAKDV
jgi:hypothetical protein